MITQEEFIVKHVDYEIIDSEAKLQTMLDQLRKLNPASISLDIETTHLMAVHGAIRLVQIGVLTPAMEKQWLVDQFAVDITPLQKLMETPRVVKNIQFAAFEYNWFYVHFGWQLRSVIDPHAMMKVLRLEGKKDKSLVFPPGNALKDQAHMIGIELEKDMGEHDWTQPLQEPHLQYAAVDVAILPYLVNRHYPVMVRYPDAFSAMTYLTNQSIERVYLEQDLNNANDLDKYQQVLEHLQGNAGLPTSDDEEIQQLQEALRRQPLTAANKSKLLTMFTQPT